MADGGGFFFGTDNKESLTPGTDPRNFFTCHDGICTLYSHYGLAIGLVVCFCERRNAYVKEGYAQAADADRFMYIVGRFVDGACSCCCRR